MDSALPRASSSQAHDDWYQPLPVFFRSWLLWNKLGLTQLFCWLVSLNTSRSNNYTVWVLCERRITSKLGILSPEWAWLSSLQKYEQLLFPLFSPHLLNDVLSDVKNKSQVLSFLWVRTPLLTPVSLLTLTPELLQESRIVERGIVLRSQVNPHNDEWFQAQQPLFHFSRI